MRKKAWKKNIAILLVIAMMLTIMPMTVFAEGETDENDVTSESVRNVVLNDQSEVKVETGVPFNVKVKATTDSAVFVQWTIGEDKEATLTPIDGDRFSIRENVIFSEAGQVTITATFLDGDGNEIVDENPVSATFTVKEKDNDEFVPGNPLEPITPVKFETEISKNKPLAR